MDIKVAMVHIGDSRAYLLRGDQLTQVSTDHTFVQTLVDDGQITAEQATSHPFRSAVVRYLSSEDRHAPDLKLLDVQIGDRLMLCSDGLSDLVSDVHIAELLRERSRAAATQGLISAALRSGGRDNITCVVGDLAAGDLETWSRRYPLMDGAVAGIRNIADPLVGVRAG